jgi:beta-lactamase regulating signal transducer with metallopeptidase domain
MSFAIITVDWSALASGVVVRLVDGALGGAAIAVLSGMLLWGGRRLSASTRFLILFSALSGMIASLLFWSPSRIGLNSLPTFRLVLPVSWALCLFLAWVLAALFGLARIAFALWRLQCLRRSCVALAPGKMPLAVQSALAQFPSKRAVQVCTSDQIQAPTALGLFHPAVVLPCWCVNDDEDEAELSSDELYQVVLHELAHLRRWDDWTNLAQKVAKSLLFFHPAMWWIEPRLSLAREMACDEVVLSRTGNRLAYARCLVRLAERAHLRQSLELAQAAVGRICQTTARVLRIIDSKTTLPGTIKRPRLALAAACWMIVVLAVGQMPEFVSFRSPSVAVATRTDAHSALPQAAMIPASWTVPNQARRAVSAIVKKPSRNVIVAHGKKLFAHPEPRVIPASLPLNSKTVYIVVTEFKFFGPGLSSFKVRMWQVALPISQEMAAGGVERRTL